MSKTPTRVFFLASEADPFVKVGGLGDVAGSLPRALNRLVDDNSLKQVDIRLAIPFHNSISQTRYSLKKVASFSVPHASGPLAAEAYLTSLGGMPVYLIAGAPITSANSVYSSDWGFDAHKYIFFSLACLELARHLNWAPDILHANDWHTAAAVYQLYLNRGADPFFAKTATILGIHNLPYLGTAGSIPLGAFGLPPAADPRLPDWARHLPLPLGLLGADQLVPVSPTYADEILTPEFGSGLEGFLLTRKETITGILNGIDLEQWNPVSDLYLPTNFTLGEFELRKANKIALQHELGLAVNHQGLPIPLLAMITRMDYQKGVDIALAGLEQLVRDSRTNKIPWQAIILGTGLPELEEATRDFELRHPDRLRAVLRFDAPLSHRIYGGADALLMPSRYEPCGLAQMIAMRYGCVPVACATGGLRDTIIDPGDEAAGTGFLFSLPSQESMVNALRRTLQAYSSPERWQAIQLRGMQQDYSWEKSAHQYFELYRSLLN